MVEMFAVAATVLTTTSATAEYPLLQWFTNIQERIAIGQVIGLDFLNSIDITSICNETALIDWVINRIIKMNNAMTATTTKHVSIWMISWFSTHTQREREREREPIETFIYLLKHIKIPSNQFFSLLFVDGRRGEGVSFILPITQCSVNQSTRQTVVGQLNCLCGSWTEISNWIRNHMSLIINWVKSKRIKLLNKYMTRSIK